MTIKIKLPDDITDRIDEAYNALDNALTLMEGTPANRLEEAEEAVYAASDLYSSLYLDAEAEIFSQIGKFGGIKEDHKHAKDLVHIIIGRSAMEVYREKIQNPDLEPTTASYNKAKEEAFDIVEECYLYNKLVALGEVMASKNMGNELREILSSYK